MKNCKIICPECSSIIETHYPEAMIWERCPVCRHHEWELGDLMMAEAAPTNTSDGEHAHMRIQTH